jgi:homoserine dehydrogenase
VPRHLSFAFLGFGTVGRALVALLEQRRQALRQQYGLTYRVTGVATRRTGWIANAAGLDPALPIGTPAPDIDGWLAAARPDVVFEAIPLDPHTGEPALRYLLTALEAGAHVVSANNCTSDHGHELLQRAPATRGGRYLYEAAVMDGAPVFSLVRHCLPVAGLRAVRGIFTSTATVVLEAVERGLAMDDGIAEAVRLGIAEADPSFDIDGWDSAVKLCAIATVMFGAPITPDRVDRTGIRTLDAADIRRAAAAGAPFRLVGELEAGDAALAARVAPQRVRRDDPLAAAQGTTLVMHYEAEVFPGGLTVTSHDPDPTTTAYGMLADLVEIVTAR